MTNCKKCGTSIAKGYYCTECRRIMRQNIYIANKEKNPTRLELECRKENCTTNFISTNGKKYCLEHR